MTLSIDLWTLLIGAACGAAAARFARGRNALLKAAAIGAAVAVAMGFLRGFL